MKWLGLAELKVLVSRELFVQWRRERLMATRKRLERKLEQLEARDRELRDSLGMSVQRPLFGGGQ